MSYIPNLLTLLRIAAVPVLILMLKDEAYAFALVLFVLAGLSDGLDGYIAKRYHYETRLGAILDPVADKLLLVSCFVMLSLLGKIPFWLMVIIAFRDLLIVGGYLMLVILDGTVAMRPSVVSKINTVLQIALVAATLAQNAHWVTWPVLANVLIYTVTLTTIWSGAQYVWVWGFRRESTVAGRSVQR